MIITCIRLFFEFFKTGLFSIGGGLATVPFLYEMSESTGWFTSGELADMIAISECTPGPLGCNMASYVGFTVCGIPGSILAVTGLVTPSIIIIIAISKILAKFRDSPLVESVFYGLRPASVGLIAAAGIGVVQTALMDIDLWQATSNLTDLFNIKAVILAVVIFFAMKKIKLHPIFFLGVSAAVGIIFQF